MIYSWRLLSLAIIQPSHAARVLDTIAFEEAEVFIYVGPNIIGIEMNGIEF